MLLDRNIETVLEALCACGPTIASVEEQRLALESKQHNAWDRILVKAAAESRKGLRALDLERLPSLAYLVDQVVRALTS